MVDDKTKNKRIVSQNLCDRFGLGLTIVPKPKDRKVQDHVSDQPSVMKIGEKSKQGNRAI